MDRATKGFTQMEPKLRKKLILGLILTVIGATLFFGYDAMISGLLKSQLVIDGPPNEFTKVWNKAPLPILVEVYLFNLENPDEFANGAKAKLREMGPYTYNLGMYHEVISFNSDKTRVKFWEINSFEHLPNHPDGKKLTDKITTVNFPVYAMANMVRQLVEKMPLGFAIQPVAFGFVNLLFASHGEGLIIKSTVGELLNGYTFSILQTIDTVVKPLAMFGIKMPDTGMPDNKFGFLSTKNFSRGGPFESYTGQKGTKLLEIVNYQDKRTLDYYDDASCNRLAGTEGTILEPMPDKNKIYEVFTMATCRVFELAYQKDTSFGGIPTYRFTPHPLLFSSPSKNPRNKCSCYEEDQDWCDGAFDLSRCLMGAPVAYSFPHFLGAGRLLKNNVIGMEPNPDIHTAYIDVEKHIGSALSGSEKLQMNGILHPIPYLFGFRQIRKTFYPLLWMNKVASLDDDLTMKMRMAIYPLYGIYYISLALMLFGLFTLTRAVRTLYKKRGQGTLSPSDLDRQSTHSDEPLKKSFNRSSYEQPAIANNPYDPQASFNQQNSQLNSSKRPHQLEPNYPHLEPEASRNIRRRLSNSNANNISTISYGQPDNYNNPGPSHYYKNDCRTNMNNDGSAMYRNMNNNMNTSNHPQQYHNSNNTGNIPNQYPTAAITYPNPIPLSLDYVPSPPPATTVELDKPPPAAPARSRKLNSVKNNSSQIAPQERNENLTQNRNMLTEPPNGRDVYLRSGAQGVASAGSISTAAPIDSEEYDDLDHGWTSINDIVQKEPEPSNGDDKGEADNVSVPEVPADPNKPAATKRRQQHDRDNGASWSPPGSIDNQP